MKKLTGKRVWVKQHDDEDGVHLLMWCCGISSGFIALAEKEGEEPIVYVNLSGVCEVEIFRDGELKGRLLIIMRSTRTDKGDGGGVN